MIAVVHKPSHKNDHRRPGKHRHRRAPATMPQHHTGYREHDCRPTNQGNNAGMLLAMIRTINPRQTTGERRQHSAQNNRKYKSQNKNHRPIIPPTNTNRRRRLLRFHPILVTNKAYQYFPASILPLFWIIASSMFCAFSWCMISA